VVTESVASGIDDSAIAQALATLLNAGVSLHDAQTIVPVLEEAAVARSLSLHTAVTALTSTLGGDSAALLALDPHVRPLLARNAHLSEILKQISHDYNHAISSPSAATRAAQAAQALKLRCHG
jgi:hypothetical protein